ncbi:hypothetical protein EVA_05155 [gut metagenome]|uniref:Uncharacterized protein n=1 Tax=gut metagenome TaxID=749906 RepID=J9GV38_9ZZZZ
MKFVGHSEPTYKQKDCTCLLFHRRQVYSFLFYVYYASRKCCFKGLPDTVGEAVLKSILPLGITVSGFYVL